MHIEAEFVSNDGRGAWVDFFKEKKWAAKLAIYESGEGDCEVIGDVGQVYWKYHERIGPPEIALVLEDLVQRLNALS